MEKILKKLFEYQKFANNPSLQKIIEESEARCAYQELPDSALSFATGGKKEAENTEPQDIKK